MSQTGVTPPPAAEPNNQDLLVWALYTLGGSSEWVDVEDVFLRCFELAPARLGWRTRPDLPDYKKCAKALQSVEAQSHVGLLAKMGQYQRRLSSRGTAWCEQHRSQLEDLYGGGSHVEPPSSSGDARLVRRIRQHPVFEDWAQSGELRAAEWDLADLLQCSTASGSTIWDQRLDELEAAANRSADPEVHALAQAIRARRASEF